MENTRYKSGARSFAATRSKVSFDATLREEGSFCDAAVGPKRVWRCLSPTSRCFGLRGIWWSARRSLGPPIAALQQNARKLRELRHCLNLSSIPRTRWPRCTTTRSAPAPAFAGSTTAPVGVRDATARLTRSPPGRVLLRRSSGQCWRGWTSVLAPCRRAENNGA